MPSNWLSFVPHFTAQDILLHMDEAPVGREQRFDAVGLFADVSGFTAISETLGKTGKSGTEELTHILNSYFEPMINLITSYGGIIGKFGGDAMTVLFPYQTSHAQAATVRRAIQCALDMQANMRRYEAIATSAGTFSLTMKAGLAMGRVLCLSVDDPVIRLEYVIAGEVLDRCADAEHLAKQGEVVVHHSLLARAEDAEIKTQHGEFACVTGLKQTPPKAPLPPILHVPPQAVGIIASYLHPVIADRLRTDQTGFINEHRRVTVLFANFTGLDYDHDPQVGTKVQAYLTAAIRAVQRYDGYLNKVDMGDKGSKLVILFGAPVAHENDEERALRCALELQQLPETRCIGANTGYVYCGQVGSHIRREYTVMGDVVNLAARLMQAARQGQILVSSSSRSATLSRFTWEALASIYVKGKSEPIALYNLTGVQDQKALLLHEATYQLGMVGRTQELDTARARMERVLEGKGQILGVKGEAGMGKSRLTAEMVKLGREKQFAVYGGECQSYGTNISYLAWHNIWRAFFEVDPTVSLDTQIELLEARLTAVNPKFARRLPLLGSVLNLHIPENDLTLSLDAAARIDLLFSLLLDCLQRRVTHEGGAWRAMPLQTRSTSAPLMIVLEDCHWIDPLSQALLDFIGRNIADLPILIVLVYRPPQDHRDPTGQVANLPHFSEIHLRELPKAEAEQLVSQKLSSLFGEQVQAPPELAARIASKGECNPFYIEEIVNYLRDRGINPADRASWQSLDLPDSLHTLMMSRIDQLGEAEKITLKVASVIGRVFRAAWVWGTNPSLGDLDSVVRHLNNLSRLDIVLLDVPDPVPEYMFKHAITQEVAYQSMAFSLREALHEQVALFIERAYADDLYGYIDVLAYHYGSSANIEKQRAYFRQAGDMAKAAYANETAIDYYQRLLPLLDTKDRIDILLNTGEVWQLTGEWAQAEAAYRQAMTYAESIQEAHAFARCQNALGYLLSYTGQHDEALKRLHDARQRFEQFRDYAGLAAALEHLSFVYLQQRRSDEALIYARQHQELAAGVDDRLSLGAALRNISIVYFQQSDYTRALNYCRQALDIAESIQNQQQIIYASGNMANVYLMKGDYPNALTWYKRALLVAREIGYLRTEGVIVGNMGEVYRMSGSYQQAMTCYQHALLRVVELGDLEHLWTMVRNIAEVFSAQDRLNQAEQWYQRAVSLGYVLDIPDLLCGDIYELAQLLFRQGRYQEASALNHEAQTKITDGVPPVVQCGIHLLKVRLEFALGQASRADTLRRMDDLLTTCQNDEGQANVYYARWQLAPDDTEARRQAAALYRQLSHAVPNALYLKRLAALTGESQPRRSLLVDHPDLPDLETFDLDTLLAQVDSAIITRSSVRQIPS